MNTILKRLLCLSALGILFGVPAFLVLPNAVGQGYRAIIAQAPCDGILGSRTIRSASVARDLLGSTDEEAASALLANMLKVATIDWSRQMILIVSGGTQPTSGYRVQVDKLSVARKNLIVQWRLSEPGPTDGVLQVQTQPGQIVLCDQFVGSVLFEQAVRPQAGADFGAGRLTTTVVNFDGLDAKAKGVGGAVLDEYLAKFGIKAEGITWGTTLQVVDARTLYEGKAVVASSPHNLLSQFGSNDPVAFTLRFDPPLVTFEFTRPRLLAETMDGVTHPAWQATALDAQGMPLDVERRIPSA